MERFIGLAGILAFMAIAYLLSHQRSAIHWKTIAWGLALQWIFALVVLKGTVISGLLSFLPFPIIVTRQSFQSILSVFRLIASDRRSPESANCVG